ncbi:MAG: thiamine phosphate synthase [Asticcacaulis sp.]
MTYRTRFSYLFDKATAIAEAARASTPHAPLLPPLFFVTDPQRIHHPEDICTHLPEGCGVIYRSFGESHARERAHLLRRITRDHGLLLLIGEDDALAAEAEADGLHLRERSLTRAGEIAAAHPEWRITAACHNAAAVEAAQAKAGLSAIFISPVFNSQSASAQGVTPLGTSGVKALTALSSLPVYGLGGITCDTIDQLRGCGLSGVAAVDAFRLAD